MVGFTNGCCVYGDLMKGDQNSCGCAELFILGTGRTWDIRLRDVCPGKHPTITGTNLDLNPQLGD